MENFTKLGLSERLTKSLSKIFEKPTEIQEKVIPLAMKGKDVIGGSATGSGKTLAFGARIIETAERDKGIQALVLTPTRELAEQVGNVLKDFSDHKKLNVSLVYGGVSINNQIRSLQYSEVVVGTPGRILDHLQRGTIDLSNVNVLVLDEADRMLDMGFIHDVEKIIKNCPKERQTLLFSATISRDIEHIAEKTMKKPITVSLKSQVDPRKLKQIYYDVPRNLKFSLLVHLLKQEKHGLVMVFCNTRRNTDFVAKNLKRFNIPVSGIHGGLTQQKRNLIMKIFHEKNVYVLVCTDVAARGLDVKGVSHVYNYDIPKNSTEYIHRIGRTARAGKEGLAINILSDRDYDNFRNVTDNEELNIEEKELPLIEKVRTHLKKPDDKEGYGRRKWDSKDWKKGSSRRSDRSPRPRSSRDSGRRSSRPSGSKSKGSRGSQRKDSRTR